MTTKEIEINRQGEKVKCIIKKFTHGEECDMEDEYIVTSFSGNTEPQIRIKTGTMKTLKVHHGAVKAPFPTDIQSLRNISTPEDKSSFNQLYNEIEQFNSIIPMDPKKKENSSAKPDTPSKNNVQQTGG